MKKYISVFGLIARGSIYKIIICFILMLISEILLFSFKLEKAINLHSTGFSMSQLETLIDNSFIKWVFTLGFVIVTFYLCIIGTEYGNSQTSYTIKRLRISERNVFFCQAVYNTIIFISLWAVQALTVFILCLRYVHTSPEEVIGNQTVFLAFYRNDLLHNILPLSDILVWIRNIFIALGLGFTSAEFTYKQRRKKLGATVIAFALYTIFFFSKELANTFNSYLTIIVSIIIIGETLYTVYKKDEEVVSNG